MLYLVFSHRAEDPPLRIGPVPSFSVRGADIADHEGSVLARHIGQRWTAQRRSFYRMDCAGPVLVKLQDAAPRGPFDHFSLVNGTAYASRDLFAHYSEQDRAWHLHASGERIAALVVTAAG